MKPFEVVRETATGKLAAPTAPVSIEAESRDVERRFGPYVLSNELATAVNVALCLGQPLLVTGEPGCGKTALAWAIAEQLGTSVLEFHTKSTSVAKDLLYTFDTLRRFHDASAGLAESRDAARYVSYQALGEAIRSEKTTVVLIDEIDKAPRDFPNDLLHELDQMEFTVQELSPPVRFVRKAKHFVLITSNSERRLPLPFLRRCVYAHLEFPNGEMLSRIVALHVDRAVPSSFVAMAVRRFLELRKVERLAKPPATGELVGWVRVLERMGVDEKTIVSAPLDRLPALEAMVKTQGDRARVAERARAGH